MSFTSCRLRLTEPHRVQCVRKTAPSSVFQRHTADRAAFCSLAMSTLLSAMTMGFLALFAGGYLSITPEPSMPSRSPADQQQVAPALDSSDSMLQAEHAFTLD